MTPEMLDGLATVLLIFGPFLLILFVGGIIADYILPHIKPIQRWLDSLPNWDEDDF